MTDDEKHEIQAQIDGLGVDVERLREINSTLYRVLKSIMRRADNSQIVISPQPEPCETPQGIAIRRQRLYFRTTMDEIEFLIEHLEV